MTGDNPRDDADVASASVVPEIVVLSAPRNGTNFFCECLDGLPEVLGLYEVFAPGGVYGAGREHVLSALGDVLGETLESDADPRLLSVFREDPERALAVLADVTTRIGCSILGYKVFPGQVDERTLARLIEAPHRHPFFLVRSRLDVFVSYRKVHLSDTWKNADTSGVKPEIDVDEFLDWAVVNDAWFDRLADGLEAHGKSYRVVSYGRDVDRSKSDLLRALRATLRADGLDVTLPASLPRERFHRQDVDADPFSKIANGPE